MAQHSSKHSQYHIATANRLRDGVVVYFDAQGHWQEKLESAQIASTPEEADALLARAEQAGKEVLDVYLFALSEPTGFRPASMREQIRAKGPSIAFLPKEEAG